MTRQMDCSVMHVMSVSEKNGQIKQPVSHNIAGGRALGWYAMAIVDNLDFIPLHEPGRDSVLVILNQIAKTLKKYQKSGRFVVSGYG